MKNWMKKVYKFVLSGTPVHHLSILPTKDYDDAFVFKQSMVIPVISLNEYLNNLKEKR